MEEPDGEQPCTSWNSGGLVVAIYEGEWFVAEILKNQDRVPRDYLRLSYTSHRGENIFTWPDRKDLMLTVREDIICENVKVVPVNSRGHFALCPEDYKKVKKIMMVVVLYKILFLFEVDVQVRKQIINCFII